MIESLHAVYFVEAASTGSRAMRIEIFVIFRNCIFESITGRENTGGYRPVLLPGWIFDFLAVGYLVLSNCVGLTLEGRPPLRLRGNTFRPPQRHY